MISLFKTPEVPLHYLFYLGLSIVLILFQVPSGGRTDDTLENTMGNLNNHVKN